MVGTVVPRARPGADADADEVIAAVHRGIVAVDIKSGTVGEFLGNPPEVQAAWDTRWNDGKCDPAGRLWAGTMGLFCEKDKGALYYLDTDDAHTFTRVVSPATVPNGIVWTKSGRTMYWIDTMRCAVFASTSTLAAVLPPISASRLM